MTHHPAPTERQEGLAAVDPAVFLQHEVERLRDGNRKLLDELAAARKWYDDNNPIYHESYSGYPWDHA